MKTTTTPAEPRKIRLVSAPWINSPGFFNWVIQTVRPFDKPKAQELLAGLGLPEDIAARIAASDPAITWEIDETAETVIFTVPA